MFDVGRVCIKIAGRDAGKPCIILSKIDNNYVLIDGMTRRRKCNIKHLEPLAEKINIKENEEHDKIIEELVKLGFRKEKKSQPKPQKPRPKKQKIVKKTLEKKTKKELKKERKEQKKAEKLIKKQSKGKESTPRKKETKEIKAEQPIQKINLSKEKTM